jgi:hypothetical protein
MRCMSRLLLAVYIVGAALGIVFTDARPIRRVGLALAWPLGVAAMVVTITALVLASLVLFPVVGAVAVGAAVLWWVVQ